MMLLVLDLSTTAMGLTVALTLLALLLSALFSAAEASLISTPAYYRRHLVQRPTEEDTDTHRLGSPNRVFVTMLVGNHLSNAAAAILIATLVLANVIAPLWVGLLFAIITALVVLLVLGELLPRALATVNPDRAATWVTTPILILQTAFYPAIRSFEALSSGMLSLFGAPLERRVFLDEKELQHVLEVGEQQGLIEEEERDMIESVIEFGEDDVGHVMVPRTDIVAVHAQTPIREVAEQVTDTGYSRIPVYEDDLDDVVGVVYGKDVLEAVSNNIEGPVAQIMTEALFVPETAPLDETLREMKTRRIHIALVHDEFGGTAGLVTLEDVLEEIVGDIFDEYDPETEPIEWVSEETALLDARMDIEEVNDALGTHLPEGEGYETLGGYLFHELGRPGRAGERVTRNGVVFVLERVSNRRILQVRAALPPDQGEHDLEPEDLGIDE